MSSLVSFVFYYHSTRTDNLGQTLRLLARREPDILPHSELVLVCQDRGDTPDHSFPAVKHINLGREAYNKPLMNNLGVREASGDVIVLLDSDRVLPHGYFTRQVCSVQPRQCISTTELWKLKRPATDAEIDALSVPREPDYRTKTNEMHTKNMFSGNTVMRKADYLAAGGMDESFEGYGYNDTDFTQTMTKHGAVFVWTADLELHLHHPPGLQGRAMIESNVRNGIRYCNKWRLKPGPILARRAKDIGIDLADHVNLLKRRKLFI